MVELVDKDRNWGKIPVVTAHLNALSKGVLEQDEGAAFGAALQALQVVEPGISIEELVDTHLTKDESRCCEPRSAAVNNYKDIYEDYQRAVDAVAGMYA